MSATNIGFQRIQSTKSRIGKVRDTDDFRTPAFECGDEDASYSFARKDARRQRLETSRRKLVASLNR